MGNAGTVEYSVHGYSLLCLKLKRVFLNPIGSDPPGINTVDYFLFSKGEPVPVRGKVERFGDAGEGGVSFEDDEFCNVGVKFAPTEFEYVDLIAEQDGIEYATGFSSEGPTVEVAKPVHRDILGIVMG